MEPSEISAVIESVVGNAVPRSAEADVLRRQLLDTVATMRNSMSDTPVGAYFGVFPSNVHQALIAVRQTLELLLPVAFAFPALRAADLTSAIDEFRSTFVATVAAPQDQSRLQSLLTACEQATSTLTESAALAAMVRTAYESARSAALSVVHDQEALTLQLKGEVEAARISLKANQESLIQDLSVRGSEVVARAKKEVRDTLLETAKSEFDRSRKWLWAQVGAWLAAAALAIYSFFRYSTILAAEQNLPQEWTWQIAYYTGIRIVIIGGIGAVASFCLRMLKGHLNLVHITAHRSRVVNSVAAFVEAAPREQQFEIFRLLIDTIVSPLNTGIADDNPELVAASARLIDHLGSKSTKE